MRRKSYDAGAIRVWLGAGIVAALCAALPLQAAMISGFTPASAPPGTIITLTGSDLTGVSQLKFDTVLADFEILSPTKITCVVPVGALTGPIRLVKANSTYSSATSFTVPPRIGSFSPVRGIAGEGVVVQGTNFITGATTVHFKGGQSGNVTVISPAQLHATVPANAETGPITVTTAAGSDVSAQPFTVSSAPLVTGFSPKAGPIGTSVMVTGANFFPGTEVRINNVKAAVSITSTTQLHATIPTGATTGPITVTTAAGTAVSTDNFVTGTQPIITDFSPKAGGPGTAVVIDGHNFTGATAVRFNGVQAAVTGLSATRIQTFVPSGATTGPITVTTAAGTGTSSESFIAGTQPMITGFSPAIGSPGQFVTINGLNLGTVTAVRFNEVNAPFNITALTQVRATIPNNATTGPIKVISPSGTATSSSNFTVVGVAPHISRFEPDAGPRGTQVIISGVNFAAGAAVRFNGVLADNIFVASDTQIQAAVPMNGTSGPITVTTGQATGTSATVFHVPPRLTSFSPQSAIVGTELNLHGRNLGHATLVELNSQPLEHAVVSETQLRFIVPTNATSGPFRVSTPAGVYITTDRFTIWPKVYSFTPGIGPAGTSVVIEGTSLFNVDRVEFNGVNANFKILSSEAVQATVPEGSSTGSIRVRTPDGNDLTIAPFTVTKPSDLAVTKTGVPAVLRVGETVTYTVVATNHGPSIVTGARVVSTLPSGIKLLSAESTRGTALVSNNIATVNLGLFTNAHSATITLTALASHRGSFTNTTTISAVESELRPTDNTAVVITRVFTDEDTILQIHRLTNQVVEVSWPVSPVSFSLQRKDSLAPALPWTTVLGVPRVVENRNVVTNSISGAARYYRLWHPQ